MALLPVTQLVQSPEGSQSSAHAALNFIYTLLSILISQGLGPKILPHVCWSLKTGYKPCHCSLFLNSLLICLVCSFFLLISRAIQFFLEMTCCSLLWFELGFETSDQDAPHFCTRSWRNCGVIYEASYQSSKDNIFSAAVPFLQRKICLCFVNFHLYIYIHIKKYLFYTHHVWHDVCIKAKWKQLPSKCWKRSCLKMTAPKPSAI